MLDFFSCPIQEA